MWYVGIGNYFPCIFAKEVDGKRLFVWTNDQRTLGM